MTSDSTTLAELEGLLTAIRGHGDPRRATNEWKQVYRLLQKTALPAARVAGVVGMRDVVELAGIIAELQCPSVVAPLPDAPGAEVCAKAFQAFRKRLSLTILDDESKLGRYPLTKGAESNVAGIIPPREWPEPVWEELVRQGKLRYIGHGFYALGKP